MAKKKTKVAKKQAAVSAEKTLNLVAEFVGEEVVSKAEAFDAIEALSSKVDEFESKYMKAKDASLAAKKTFDESDKELRELIRQFRGEEGGLFNQGSNRGLSTSEKK